MSKRDVGKGDLKCAGVIDEYKRELSCVYKEMA